MTAIPSQIPLVDRKQELAELKNHLNNAAQGQGNLLFIAGEDGVGKTRLLDELKNHAQSQGVQILQGWSLYESLTPYMPFIDALRSAKLDHLFSREDPPKVECVYLITDTGLLIKDVIREETKLDSTIFAGMLTAVGEFVKDSLSILSGEEKKDALNSLGYENYRILIESGLNANLVVILTGRENEFLINDMKEVLINVEQHYGNMLKSWDGDDKHVKGIEDFLKPLITSGKYDGIDYTKDDPQIKRNLLFENILLGMVRHSKVNPSLLCIEDLQWADPSTLALMHYIARNTRKCNLLILGTYRPEDVTTTKEGKVHPLIESMQLMSREDLYKKIELERLEEGHIDELLTSLLGENAFTDEFMNQLYEETEGNPFFIVTLIRMLIEEKTIQKKDDVWVLMKDIEEANIPSKVCDVVIRRLNRVKVGERKILDYAAVIGEEFTSDILAYSTHLNKIDLLEQLRTLEQNHKLIHSMEAKYKFDHGKIKEVLYSKIPAELRIEYHAVVANSIETINMDKLDEVIGDLAFHFYHCRNREKALPYLIKGAEKAKKDYSNEEAIMFYNQALELEEDAQKRIEIFEALGDIYDLIGDYDNGMESYNNTLELIEGNKNIAGIKVKMGRLFEKKGEYDESIRVCTEALDLVKGEGCIEEALALENIGFVHLRQGEYDRAFDHLNKSLKIAEKIANQKGIATCLRYIGFAHWQMAEIDKAFESLNKSLGILEKIGDQQNIADCLCDLGLVHIDKGEFDNAFNYFTKGLKINEKRSDPRGITRILGNIGYLHRCTGEYEKALENFQKCLRIDKKIGDQAGILSDHMLIGEALLVMEEYDKALENLEKGLVMNEKVGSQWSTVWINCFMAETFLKKGDLGRALDFCTQSFDLSNKIGVKWTIGASKRIFGMIYSEQKKWKESIENFDESIKTFRETDSKWELGDAFYEYGLMWKKKGDVEKAKEHLNNALDIYEKLKLEKHMGKVTSALEDLQNETISSFIRE